jgi:Ni,Fe-hydrogenase I cytochrome b subunit
VVLNIRCEFLNICRACFAKRARNPAFQPARWFVYTLSVFLQIAGAYVNRLKKVLDGIFATNPKRISSAL